MFGDDGGGDDGGMSFGELLFGLWLWREVDAGRIQPGCIFRAIALLVLVLGGGLLLLIAIGSAMTPRYQGNGDPWTPAPTYRPAVVPPDWTQAPATTPAPTPTKSPAATPKPTPLPRMGDRVAGAALSVAPPLGEGIDGAIALADLDQRHPLAAVVSTAQG